MPCGRRRKNSDAFDGKQSKRQRTRDFEYDKLPTGHIRILQVTHELKRNGRRQLSAQLRSFHVEHLPHFLALSYAWPEAGAPTRTLPCNDRHVSLSTHIYAALENLIPIDAACSFAIWIDAICIDQDNDFEKNKQVPHMEAIYGRASQTIVWLGPNDLVDRHGELIEYISRHPESVPDTFGPPPLTYLCRPPFSEQRDEIWVAVGRMISSRWFRRLWTVQELCLAQQVSILCGHCFLSWDSMTMLSWKASNAASEHGLDFQTLNICRNSCRQFDARGILQLLDNLTCRSVTKPIDKVYGLMFLLPKAIQDSIEVDYSREKEYWTTYIKLAHLLLLQPGGLSVLCAAPGIIRPVQLPSWCPNWNERSCWSPLPQASDKSIGCGGPLQPLKAPNFRILNDLREIAVYGFRMDRIICTIPFHPSVKLQGRRWKQEWTFWQQRCLQHLEETMKPDTPHVSILSTHLRNLRLGLWTHDNGEMELMNVDDLSEINRCYEELISSYAVFENPSNSFPAEKLERDHLTPSAEKFLNIGGIYRKHTYFFTEQGRVGRGCPGDRAGDILVALYTAPELFVLRYEDGSDVARLIGEAYLDGCMDLNTMPSEGREPDEWFTLG
jgi:hypothetical protein